MVASFRLEMHKIPEKYKVVLDSTKDQRSTAIQNNGAESTPTNQPSDEPKESAATASTSSRPRKCEKIKLTKAELTFSGPTAFLSHMHRCSFVYNKVPYTSVEQGYHYIHATVEHNAYDLKNLSEQIPDSEEWSQMAPVTMWDLNECKYDQNPDLRKNLLETAPHKLIEASVDSKWGGACPFLSDIYEQGMIPGANLCGNQLTKYRDDLITKMSEYKMS